ncbi:MAG: hypothetical protein M0P69_11145 [Bacteroidales bacterium]|nr:hypothetical protein [Bacteroidales bacterium]
MAIRIVYDGKQIELMIGPDGLQVVQKQERGQSFSGSGKIRTLSQYGIQEYIFDAYFQDTIYYDLIAWWSWARQGKGWSFAMDSSKAASTTLDGTAASGQKVIPLTATAGLAAGDICLVATAADDAFEVVEVGSVSAGVSVTAKADLKFTHAAGDTLRHLDYFPSVVSTDTEFNPDRSGDWWRHTFNFVEMKSEIIATSDTLLTVSSDVTGKFLIPPAYLLTETGSYLLIDGTDRLIL